MYLHLGKGWVVSGSDIVAIFDLDNSSQSHITRKYLSSAEKAGQVINAAEDIPKSFIITECKNERRVYLSQMASATLLKRWESGTM